MQRRFTEETSPENNAFAKKFRLKKAKNILLRNECTSETEDSKLYLDQNSFSVQNRNSNHNPTLLKYQSLTISSSKATNSNNLNLTVKQKRGLFPLKCQPNTRKSNTQKLNQMTFEQISLNRKIISLKSCKNNNNYQYFYLCNRGGRIYNEDRISIQTQIYINEKQYQYFAVFDGHGGSYTADFLMKNLHLLFEKYLLEGNSIILSLKLSLAECETKIQNSTLNMKKSGSCASICILHEKKCYVASIGDCRVLKIDSNNKWKQITTDHKPENQQERVRIQLYGGKVYRNPSYVNDQGKIIKKPFRVMPGKISVSRTIGDILIKKEINQGIISNQPDTFEFDLADTATILIFSDGVYETMNNSQISSYFVSNKDIVQGIKKSFEEMQLRNGEDNRSMIAIKIK